MAPAAGGVVADDALDDEFSLANGVQRGCGESFGASTPVLTPTGERAIASLKVGDQVTAYDPQTGTSSSQRVEATSIHHDDNLVDVTLKVTTPAHASVQATATAAGKSATPATGTSIATEATAPQAKLAPSTTHTEVVHTTANHPWLSADHGWLIASFLQVGEPVLQADGSVATVVSVRSVPGAAEMWDLTVSQVHTFAVGSGAYVVHNCAELDNWRDHSTHFADDWKARGRPSTDEMDDVLTNGRSLYDTRTTNYAQAGKIRGKWYTIWYKDPDDPRLVSIQDEAHGGYRPYDSNVGRRWWSAPHYNPQWRNPFGYQD